MIEIKTYQQGRNDFIELCEEELDRRDHIAEMSDDYNETKNERAENDKIRRFINRMKAKAENER